MKSPVSTDLISLYRMGFVGMDLWITVYCHLPFYTFRRWLYKYTFQIVQGK